MKKLVAIILAVFMMLSCSAVCFAAESMDVFAKYVGESKRTEIPVSDDSASATLPDGIHVTVENIPSDAVVLVIYSIPSSETEAWDWINSCFKDLSVPVHAFDIYFVDASGNRTNANGAVVTIQCPHCENAPAVYSLTTDEKVTELNSANGVFTTDGSHYYVMAVESSDGDHEIDIEDNEGGDVEVSDKTPSTGDTVIITPKPDDGKVVDTITVTDKDGNEIEVKDNGDGSYSYEQPDSDVTIDVTFKDRETGADNKPYTGDNSHIALWSSVMVISAAGICILTFLYFKRKKQES